jgi:CMP/dCMP kinase
LVRITISGHPGSGTSTLVSAICDAKGWSSLNGGDIFRQEAKNRNVSLSEFGKICAEDESVDRSLDDILKLRMSDSEGPEVMESRLCGWWAHLLELDCIRLWLNVSESVRASRVVDREGISIDLAMSNNSKRSRVDLARFQEMYGLDPEDSTPYTHVIDASGLTREEVLEAALKILEEQK